MSGARLSPGTTRKLFVSLALAALLALGLSVLEREVEPRSLSGVALAGPARGPVLELVPQVKRVLPHDPTAFTQGLLWYRGALYESTGNYGQSSLREVEPASGEVRRRVALAAELFGEGLERVGDRLLQLTWKEGVVLEWDVASFELLKRHALPGEGWGLCYDGSRLVISDGSDKLTFRDPNDLSLLGEIQVRLRGEPVSRLNELECAEGWVYANVYGSRSIVRIDPESGSVLATIDASTLIDAELARSGVLNGIAYDGDAHTFYLTGKNWPKLFEVVFVAAPLS